jgi:beta-mannanase
VVAWPQCYPGDDVVDIVGMDSYDQRPGGSWEEFVTQPFGLRHQVEFAAARGKPVSYPEWGLYDFGDNPEYVRRMHAWLAAQNVVYHSISDYCPHGVWRCRANPASSESFRELFGP